MLVLMLMLVVFPRRTTGRAVVEHFSGDRASSTTYLFRSCSLKSVRGRCCSEQALRIPCIMLRPFHACSRRVPEVGERTVLLRAPRIPCIMLRLVHARVSPRRWGEGLVSARILFFQSFGPCAARHPRGSGGGDGFYLSRAWPWRGGQLCCRASEEV